MIDADVSLGLPDFRAAERAFQLLTQVAGRAGRGELEGSVILQSHLPDHYALQLARTQDYAASAQLQIPILMHPRALRGADKWPTRRAAGGGRITRARRASRP